MAFYRDTQHSTLPWRLGGLSPFWKISLAGFVATAITYGPARMGFGLFLSEFRETFDLSTRAAGLFSSLGFLGMLIGLFAAYALTARLGPRVPVLVGLGLATAGLGLVALATGPGALYAGVFLAMSSAGFAWSPFNNAVQQQVAPVARPTALSVVSTGTSAGIVLAGATALGLSVADVSWRAAWMGFAALGAIGLVLTLPALRAVAGEPGPKTRQPWSVLFQPKARPLYAVAFSFGLSSAVFISFAADRVAQVGMASDVSGGMMSALIWVAFGLFGLTGLATGAVKPFFGLRRLVQLLMLVSALSALLIAVQAGALGAVVLGAGLQGVFVMMMSAILSFWSAQLYPTLPALSFTMVLIWTGIGSVVGPVLGAEIAQHYGGQVMFLCVAVLSGVTALGLRNGMVYETPEVSSS